MAPKSSVQTIVIVILNSVPFLEIPKSRSYVFSQTTHCPTSGPGTTVPTDDFEDLIHWVAPDSCCGESPTWQAYSAFKKSVTNTRI